MGKKLKMTFASFKKGIELLAAKSSFDGDKKKMVGMIKSSGGPGTGKATKTGKVARGLADRHTATSKVSKTLVDKEKGGLVAMIGNREKADVRGLNKSFDKMRT